MSRTAASTVANPRAEAGADLTRRVRATMTYNISPASAGVKPAPSCLPAVTCAHPPLDKRRLDTNIIRCPPWARRPARQNGPRAAWGQFRVYESG